MAVFIHGNHDGVNERNESYNICRIHVPRERLVEEIRRGLHPFLEVVTRDGKPHPRTRPDAPAADSPFACSACRALAKERFSTYEPPGIPRSPRRLVGESEHVNREDEEKDTYFVCRLGVPRNKAVEENRAGWHPGYHVLRVDGETYLRNNPNHKSPDNINSPWSCPMI
jgi:hypothetical protein